MIVVETLMEMVPEQVLWRRPKLVLVLRFAVQNLL
jgi:hypothetical protein